MAIDAWADSSVAFPENKHQSVAFFRAHLNIVAAFNDERFFSLIIVASDPVFEVIVIVC